MSIAPKRGYKQINNFSTITTFTVSLFKCIETENIMKISLVQLCKSKVKTKLKMISQLADVFAKSWRGPRIGYACNKLGAYDLNAPA